MRQHPRIRRIAKWSGLSACVFLLAAWGATETREVYIRVPRAGVLVFASGYIGYMDAQTTAGWIPGVMIKWGDPYSWTSGPPLVLPWIGGVAVANWLLLAVFLIPTAWLWRRDRRHLPPGHCRKCAYNLTGNTSGRCPECGSRTRVEPTATGAV